MDGVLIDSEKAKVSCWLEAVAAVLNPTEESLEELDRYNRSHRGVPRETKFRHAARLLGGSDDVVVRLLATYAALLEVALAQPQAFEGGVRFVENWPGEVAVASSAPVDEVSPLLQRAGYTSIRRVFGFPTSKSKALSYLASHFATVVFFGDAQADRAAAHEAGVAFIAIGALIGHDAGDLTAADTLLDLVGREVEIVSAAATRH